MSKIAKQVIDAPAQTQLSKSFLEYSMSVVMSRALVSAEDGLKPVQRRILHSMANIDRNLPSTGYVKSARPVATTMGMFHPHGDSSIYQALVKLAQDFYLNVKFVEGYGNWGDISGSSAASSRYTECRLSPAALLVAGEVNEGTVPMRPNYDGTTEEPSLLPVQFPVLLVNGAFGIGVGFANRSAPHNPTEVMEAVRYVLRNPNATLDKVSKFMPGPDFPTGGLIIGTDGIKEAYETGTGKFRIRARHTVLPGVRGRSEIIFNELPYEVSTDKVMEEIKSGLKDGRFGGLFDAKDLTDRKNGLRVVVETKPGVKPDVLLNELLAYTSLEITFGVNNTVLVNTAPKTIGLMETINLFLDFRRQVVKNRSQYRKDKRETRLHLVEGLLKALANIDEVIKIVRGADNAAKASEGLQKKFKIDDIQASYILEIPLRRLTKLDQIELQTEHDKLKNEIAELNSILKSPKVLDDLIFKELGEVQKQLGRERRSTIIGGTLAEHAEAVKEVAATANGSIKVTEEPCWVSITPKWGVVRADKEPKKAMRSLLATTTTSKIIAITNKGKAFRMDAYIVGERESKTSTILPVKLPNDEKVIGFMPAELEEGKTGGIALGTRNGTVKIVTPTWPMRSDEFDIINLTEGDEIVGAGWVSDSSAYDFVFIANDSSFLTFPADKVRPSGLSAAGVVGMGLKNNKVVSFSVVEKHKRNEYVVVSTTGSSIKATPFFTEIYPSKGRATGGYASYSFTKTEKELVAATVSHKGVFFSDQGQVVKLPPINPKRVASGVKIENESLF